MSNIRIDGEDFDVTNDYGNTVSEGRTEFKLFASREEAGKEARAYYADMADSDPREFRHMVGDETLVAWALGRRAGPGAQQVESLSEWLDLWLDSPEEHFSSYDGVERDVEPPTIPEQARAEFIWSLSLAFEKGKWHTDGSTCMGVEFDGKTWWLMEEGHKGHLGTRFSSEPDGWAIAASPTDVREALEDDKVFVFVTSWEKLVEELGFTPTVAYRSN